MPGLAKSVSHRLQVDWTYEGCDTLDERHIEEHWQGLQAGLEGKLTELDDPPAHLRVAVECNDTEPQWQVQAALHLPGVTVVAETEHNLLEEALADLVAILAHRIDLVRDRPKEVTLRRDGLQAVAAL